eukprot:02282.XXX_23442_25302_1 [CDS] Oithona nana genome sequencing.
MECPHLNERVKINLEKIKTIVNISVLQCSQCDAKESIWICLTTGVLNCGRYVKAHALAHYEKTGHSVCMECRELSIFCYACDDFIINDTSDGKLDRFRSDLVQLRNNPTTLNDKAEPSRSLRPRSSRRRSQSFDSVNGGSNVENRPANKKSRKSAPAHSGISKNSPNSRTRKSSGEALKNLVGLRNLGNTCFMSVVLQSLGNINEFCRVLKQLPALDEHLSSNSSKSNFNSIAKSKESRSKNVLTPNAAGAEGPIMTEELRKVLLALSQDDLIKKKVISPEALFHVIWKVVPRFRGYQQQDAHEFLRYMLDRLHTELLTLLPGDVNFLQQQNLSPYSRMRRSGFPSQSSHSLVTSIFGGTLQSEVTCLHCQTSSKKHDPFLDLSVDIPAAFLQLRKAKDCEDRQPCTLYDCLQKFVDVEELAETERFFCNNCKNKQRSTKKFWIRRLPNVSSNSFIIDFSLEGESLPHPES